MTTNLQEFEENIRADERRKIQRDVERNGFENVKSGKKMAKKLRQAYGRDLKQQAKERVAAVSENSWRFESSRPHMMKKEENKLMVVAIIMAVFCLFMTVQVVKSCYGYESEVLSIWGVECVDK